MPSQVSSSPARDTGRGSPGPGLGRLLGPAGRGLSVCLVLALPVWAGAAPEEAPGGAGLGDEVERLQGEVKRLEATVEELQAGRAEVAEEMRALRAEMQRLARPAAASGQAAQSAGAGSQAPAKIAANPQKKAADSAQAAAEPAEQRTVLASSEPEEVGQSKREGRRDGAERDLLERRGGVLVRAGALVTEPRLQYAHVSRNRIQISGFAVVPALVIGRIDSAEIERDIFAFALKEVIPASEPRLEGTAIDLEIEPAGFRCRACAHEFGLADTPGKADEDESEAIHFIPELAHAFLECPKCKSPDFELVQGRGVSIASIEGEAG